MTTTTYSPDRARIRELLAGHNVRYGLTGDRNAELRRAVMLALTGERLPKSKCGINALLDAMLSAYGIVGTCPADRLDKLADAIRA
jgi:hypothetical protein